MEGLYLSIDCEVKVEAIGDGKFNVEIDYFNGCFDFFKSKTRDEVEEILAKEGMS